MCYLQVQAGMECEKTDLQDVMEDLEMEDGGCSGQFGCRREEGSRWKMEETEWMEGSDEKEPMEEKSCCVLGTMVEQPDQALGPLSVE